MNSDKINHSQTNNRVLNDLISLLSSISIFSIRRKYKFLTLCLLFLPLKFTFLVLYKVGNAAESYLSIFLFYSIVVIYVKLIEREILGLYLALYLFEQIKVCLNTLTFHLHWKSCTLVHIRNLFEYICIIHFSQFWTTLK